MMQESKTEILNRVLNDGLVPVFNHSDVEVCKKVLKASYDAGIEVFEFTNRNENALTVFKDLKEYADESMNITLGVGTIYTVEKAHEYLENGAKFIVSPVMDKDLGQFCREKEILWIPGCGSMTEIHEAIKLHAQIVKIFPAISYGPKFLSAAKSVFPNLYFMPTGGVQPNHKELNEWFEAGGDCVGLGSQLYKKELIQKKKYELLSENIKATKLIIKKIKFRCQ